MNKILLVMQTIAIDYLTSKWQFNKCMEQIQPLHKYFGYFNMSTHETVWLCVCRVQQINQATTI